MKSPFVSRLAYDAVRDDRDRLSIQCETLTEEYTKLVQQMVRMKRQGFEQAREPAAKVARQAAEPEQRIERAIKHGALVERMVADIRMERPELSDAEAMRHAQELASELDPYNAQ